MSVLFSAELRNIKIIYNVLRAISFRETAVIRAMSEGLKITIEEMKCVQTSAYIPNDVFNSYNLLNEDIHFKISMKTFTECLNIFGDDGNPSLKIIYKQEGSPLMLILNHDEDDITVECQLYTMEAEELIDLNFADECRLNNVVVKANLFVNLLHELDSSSESLELLLSPKDPFFQITTDGILGEAQVDIKLGSDMLEIFKCTTETKQRYVLSHVKQLERVMAHANRVSVSMCGPDAGGLLSLQLVINVPGALSVSSDTNQKMFVEYYCTALIDE